ncbi:MAG: hypothetical protein IPK60_12975 [Sandaracinaceae bacterium]|nr:hypothetical protein [Sandaracinaceae bacterium]
MGRSISKIVFAFFVVCGAVMSACSTNESSIVVEVVSGIVPGAQFTHVTVSRVLPNAGVGTMPIDPHDIAATFGQDYAHGFRVATFDAVPHGEHTIEVLLYKENGLLLMRRRVRVQTSGDFVLRVHITPNCIGVTCPSPGGNAGLSECLDGHCVDPRCNPPSREFCDAITFCNSEGDCAATSSCAEATCIDGICDAAPLDGACPDTQWCDPAVGAGCETRALVDGGIDADASMDGGTDDAAAPDAGPLCGSTCVDPDNTCLFGVVDCEGATPVCNATLVRTGTVCGAGRVCDVSGACVDCAEGGPCQVGCAMGQLSCATGTPACHVTSTSPRLAVGNACETSCGTAGTCPTPHVCSAAGECVSCIDGEPCSIGCEMGRVSCAMGGSCVLDNTHVAPFTPCGALHICDGRGSCVTCIDGAPYADGCYGGTITSCSTAAPAPASRSLLGATSECGERDVCSGDGFGCYAPYPALDVVPMQVFYGDRAAAATCAIRNDQTVQCWGNNASGALGWGRTESPPLHTKVDVVGLSDVAELRSGGGFFCAITDVGEVWCWGHNGAGQLGNGTFERALIPTRVLLPPGARAIDVAAGQYQVCAALEDGRTFCWGQIIREAPVYGETLSIPELMPNVDHAIKLASFRYFPGTCALLADGRVLCWGEGLSGAFGDGVERDGFSGGRLAMPVEVAGIDDAIDMDHNGFIGCVVRGNHQVWCWGGAEAVWGGRAGVFGNMARDLVAYSPLLVDLLPQDPPDAEAVIASGEIYVRRAGGDVWTWNTAAAPALAPAPLDRMRASHTGYTHSCAITGDGNAVCWGSNSVGAGELGSGHGVPSTAAVPVAVIGDTP